MKILWHFLIYISLITFSTSVNGQAKKRAPSLTPNINIMNIGKLTNALVKDAIDALQAGDKKAWFALFTNDAQLFDDGHKIDFKSFFEKALGHERFTSIDKIEDAGLSIYGKFHSDQWGNFKTYFKFHVAANNQFSKLEIGQANY
jgi:hypothetical protein